MAASGEAVLITCGVLLCGVGPRVGRGWGEVDWGRLQSACRSSLARSSDSRRDTPSFGHDALLWAIFSGRDGRAEWPSPFGRAGTPAAAGGPSCVGATACGGGRYATAARVTSWCFMGVLIEQLGGTVHGRRSPEGPCFSWVVGEGGIDLLRDALLGAPCGRLLELTAVVGRVSSSLTARVAGGNLPGAAGWAVRLLPVLVPVLRVCAASSFFFFLSMCCFGTGGTRTSSLGAAPRRPLPRLPHARVARRDGWWCRAVRSGDSWRWRAYSIEYPAATRVRWSFAEQCNPRKRSKKRTKKNGCHPLF